MKSFLQNLKEGQKDDEFVYFSSEFEELKNFVFLQLLVINQLINKNKIIREKKRNLN